MGIDALDAREAPPFGDHIRLSMLEDASAYAVNYKPLQGGGASWTLQLSSSLEPAAMAGKAVTLSFDGLAGFSGDLHFAAH